MTCELCDYMADKDIYEVVYCNYCKVPMVVGKEHTPEPPEDFLECIDALAGEADRFFGEGKWRLRPQMRLIKDHWHCHTEREVL